MTEQPSPEQQKRWEWRMFLFLTVVLAPAITVGLVTAYGFAIWFSQLLMGPPGS
ncbi:nitrate reductase [Corallincola luteus]|uniref:Nitrate reductase n=3 Tax=Psychromonadaceae TaxID=267894 RepID=A0ABY1WSC1_9GAMM|nr:MULTISPECIES: periplasmic nitrate reductase, NapE protein [Corallincola]TAA47640.1 nitrate reductase [Corallincola spongiicola]TCI05622.1 nitrate reductase [Corallincola luteus]